MAWMHGTAHYVWSGPAADNARHAALVAKLGAVRPLKWPSIPGQTADLSGLHLAHLAHVLVLVAHVKPILIPNLGSIPTL